MNEHIEQFGSVILQTDDVVLVGDLLSVYLMRPTIRIVPITTPKSINDFLGECKLDNWYLLEFDDEPSEHGYKLLIKALSRLKNIINHIVEVTNDLDGQPIFTVLGSSSGNMDDYFQSYELNECDLLNQNVICAKHSETQALRKHLNELTTRPFLSSFLYLLRLRSE